MQHNPSVQKSQIDFKRLFFFTPDAQSSLFVLDLSWAIVKKCFVDFETSPDFISAWGLVGDDWIFSCLGELTL